MTELDLRHARDGEIVVLHDDTQARNGWFRLATAPPVAAVPDGTAGLPIS